MKPIIVFKKEDWRIKDREKFKLCFTNLKDGKYVIEEWKNVRSSQQNKLYWSILSEIAHYTGDLDHYSLHQYLLSRCMRTTTTDMDTSEFTDYIFFCRQWAEMNLWIYLDHLD